MSLGVAPDLKSVVLALWASYLEKMQLAFVTGEAKPGGPGLAPLWRDVQVCNTLSSDWEFGCLLYIADNPPHPKPRSPQHILQVRYCLHPHFFKWLERANSLTQAVVQTKARIS